MPELELTEKEKDLINRAADLWNAWLDLPDLNHYDNVEMQSSIHRIQHQVMARVAQRTNPELIR